MVSSQKIGPMHNIEKYALPLPGEYQPMSLRKRYEKRIEGKSGLAGENRYKRGQ
jgi:hypothetical protein